MKRRACAFCKSAKKKCDGGSPCSSCAHSDLPCFYPSQLSQPTQPRPQKPRQKQKQKQPQQQQPQQQPQQQQQQTQQQTQPHQHPQYQQLQQKLREQHLQRTREASKVKETTFHFKKLRRTHKGIEEEQAKVSFSLTPDNKGVVEEVGGLDSYKDQIGVRIGDPVFFRFPPLPPPTLKRKKKNGKTVEWCTESEEEIFWEYLGERKAVPVAEQPAEVMSPSLFVDRKNACDADRLMATVQEMNHPAYLFQSPWKRRGSFIERHGYKTEILNNPVGENFLHDPTNPSSTIFRRSHNITQVMFLRLIHQFSFSWDEVTKEVYSPYYVFFGNQLRCLFARFQFFYDRTGVSRYLIINFPYNFPSPSPSFSPFYFPLARFSRTGFPFSPPKQAPVVLLQTDEESEIDKSATQLQIFDPSLLQTATPPPLFRVFSQIQELQEQLLQPHQQQYQQLFPQQTIPPHSQTVPHFQVVEIPETQPFVSQQQPQQPQQPQPQQPQPQQPQPQQPQPQQPQPQQPQPQQLQISLQDPSPPLSSGPKTPQVLPPQQTIIEIEHQQPNPLSPTLLETQPPEQQQHHQQQEQQHKQFPPSPVFSSRPAPFSPSPFEDEFSKDTISQNDSVHSIAPSHLFPSSSSPFPSASSPPSFLSFFSSSPSLAPSPSSSPYFTSPPPSLPSRFSSSPSLPPPSPSSSPSPSSPTLLFSPSPPPSFPPPSPSHSPSSPSPFSPSSPSPFFSSLSPSSSSPSSPTPFSPSPSLSSRSPPSPSDPSPSSPSPSYSSPSPFSPAPSSPLLSLLSPSEPFPLSSPFLLSNDEFVNF